MKEKLRFAGVVVLCYLISSLAFGIVAEDIRAGLYSILFTPFNFTTGLQLFIQHTNSVFYLLVVAVPVVMIGCSFLLIERRRVIAYTMGLAAAVVLGVLNCFLFFAMMSV